MSVPHPDKTRFRIDSGDELSSSYDEEADILYLWFGDAPREAISVTSKEGHLVRLDPDTHEIVGFTVFDFCRRWQQVAGPGGHLPITTPDLGESPGEVTASSQRLLLTA